MLRTFSKSTGGQVCQPKKGPLRRKQNERGTTFIIDRLKNNDQMANGFSDSKKALFLFGEKGGGNRKSSRFIIRAPRDPVAHRSHRTIAALVARCLVPSLWPSGQPCDASPSEAGFTGPQHVFFEGTYLGSCKQIEKTMHASQTGSFPK